MASEIRSAGGGGDQLPSPQSALTIFAGLLAIIIGPKSVFTRPGLTTDKKSASIGGFAFAALHQSANDTNRPFVISGYMAQIGTRP